jgi:hypothetical protein
VSIVVFCGPTISADAVHSRVDAECRPPAAQGDIVRCLTGQPRVIAVIDGFFDHQPAVWHKEILLALSEGVHVFGAASMGALRAAELHEFGMVGVGAVFEAFRDGRLLDDDEVAVVHGPVEHGCPPLSTAMVDLRDRCERAAGAGVITHADAAALVGIAKALPYPERSLPAVTARARDHGVSEESARAIVRFTDEDGPGLKERDARALLDVIVSFIAGDPAPLNVEWELEWTVFLDALVNDVESTRHADEWGADRAGAAAPRSDVLLHLLAEAEARRLGLVLGDAEVDEAVAQVRRRYGLADAGQVVEWMKATGVDWPELVQWARRALLAERVGHVHRFEVAARTSSYLRVEDALRAAQGPS